MKYAPVKDELKAQLDNLLQETDSEDGVRHPWLQLEQEPNDAYEAFFFFRSLPSTHRSTYRAYHQFLVVRAPQVREQNPRPCNIKAPDKWDKWLGEYDWERRANAWDEAVRRILFVNETSDLNEMVKRHFKALRSLQELGMEYINTSGFDSATAALRAVIYGQDRERQLAGLPDVSHILVMDDRALLARYEELLQQLPSAIKEMVDDGGFAHIDIDAEGEDEGGNE